MPDLFQIQLVRSSCNAGALAALGAVLEVEQPELPRQLRLLRRAGDFDGQGLLVQSFLSAQADRVAGEMNELRQRHGQGLLAIAGGPHPSGCPAQTLAMGFRWVAVGEAGPSFASLVRRLADGQVPRPGLLQDSERFDLDRYAPWPSTGELFAPVELTRGCPIGCGFCQTPTLHGRRPRHRSLEALERCFRHAVETGHTFTRFVAPNALGYGSQDGRQGDRRALEQLLLTARRCGMRRLYLGSFPSEVRPESVTPELLQLLREHCDNPGIVVGLQSGSPEVLRRLRRGHTVEQAVRAVEMINRAGFRPSVDFIFGLPEESDADRLLTRQLIEHLITDQAARINTHFFTPLPGTPLQDARPTPVDAATRELLERIIGMGKANRALCDFGSGRLLARFTIGGEALSVATEQINRPTDSSVGS